MSRKTSKATSANLAALTTAALCLPAYAPAASAWAEEQGSLAYRYSHYSESSLPAAATNGQNGERYQVDSHQFRLLKPISERYELAADLVVESMSGASPWFVVPDADGRSIQVMSGATIDDQRVAIDINPRRYREQGFEGMTVGFSKERDYLSFNAGIETRQDFNGRNTSVSSALGVSSDFLEPTDGASTRFPNRIGSADKTSGQWLLAVSQALTPQTALQLGMSYSYSHGYLSDPYKQVYVDANILPDSRPSSRHQLAASVRLRQYFPALKAALHADYRRFGDSWGVVSDTLEVSWQQNLPGGWRLAPSLRWYEQGAADFYRNYFVAPRADGHYSSDYRLSAYGAVAYRLAASKQWGPWALAASAERYNSSTRYALHETGEASPGLVDFSVLSVALSWRFGAGAASPAAAGLNATPTDEQVQMQVVPLTP